VLLQGSLDNVNWLTLGTASFAGTVEAVTVTGQPMQFLRADVTEIDGTVTALVASA
jgi:hypothetical protein